MKIEGDKKTMIVDLHMHSRYSDGHLSVQELINLAVEKGIQIIALTDHDTINGIKVAKKYAQGKLKFISGLEITCQEEMLIRDAIPYSIHVLGYGIDEINVQLHMELENRQKKYLSIMEQTIEALKLYGMSFTYQDVPISCGSLMQAIDISNYIKKCYQTSPKLEPALEQVSSCVEKLNQINISIDHTIQLIHEAGGVAILAHPFIVYSNHQKSILEKNKVIELIERLKEKGIDGIEVFYHDFSEEQQAFLYQVSKPHQLSYTIGSDFHGFKNRDQMVDYEIKVPTFVESGCLLQSSTPPSG